MVVAIAKVIESNNLELEIEFCFYCSCLFNIESRKCSTNAPVQEGSILNPVLQLAHLEAPSLGQFGPTNAMPFGHIQMLATHSVRSRFTLQPVLQLDTKHPDSYDLAFSTSHTV